LSPTKDFLKSASRFASLQQQQLTCWKLRDVTAVDASAVSGTCKQASNSLCVSVSSVYTQAFAWF
jgi:hypothetical protein